MGAHRDGKEGRKSHWKLNVRKGRKKKRNKQERSENGEAGGEQPNTYPKQTPSTTGVIKRSEETTSRKTAHY